MRTSSIENWALPATLVFALAFVATVREAGHFQANAATAETSMTPHYVMTVTAKRLPASCKGAALKSNPDCLSALNADAVVEMHEASPALAAQ
ncbi:MAG: hypothetical protein GC190_12855 [Alphaproteobacteria bacterium]|nr:hypothetical protein [Alphaproteobacteria bacterium]